MPNNLITGVIDPDYNIDECMNYLIFIQYLITSYR